MTNDGLDDLDGTRIASGIAISVSPHQGCGIGEKSGDEKKC
jgi:hypothetical protein